MKSIFRFFASNHMFANIFTVMILLIGLNSILGIKKDLLPDVAFSVISITTTYPKASPEDVEINVTNKIESSLKDVEGIKEVSSLSIENISAVTVILNDSLEQAQIDAAIQDIRDAVSRIDDLPNDIQGEPVITQSNAGDRPVIIAGISAEGKTYEELRYQAEFFEKKLKKINGVSRIIKTGYLAKEVKIELNPEKIKTFQLDLNEIIFAVQKRNLRGTAGAMESFSCTQDIVTLSQFKKPGDIGDVIVRSSLDGPLIRVKDFGIIKEGYEEEKIISKINGKKVIALNIYKNESADLVDTVNLIKGVIKQTEKTMPEGFSINLSNDFSRYIDASYKVVMSNGIMGFVLVILILTIFLNFRISIWVAMGIPVSIFGTITILKMYGYSLNVISLSALLLVIGIIVDDAIIISESIYSEYEKGLKGIDAAVEGVNKVFKPIVFSLLTTVVAFFPILLIPGSFGKFIFVMPLVVIVSLCISLVESIVALPSHVSKSIDKGSRLKEKKYIKALERLYVSFLEKALKRRKRVAAAAFIILFAVFFASGWFLKVISFPDEGAESMTVNLEAPQGCGIKVTEQQIEKIEKLILELPKGEVESFVTTVGKKSKSLTKQNYANISMNLTPFSDRERTAINIADDLRIKINSMKDIGTVTFDIMGAGPSPGKAVSFKIIGNNNDVRKQVSNEMFEYLNSINGVIESERDDAEGKGQVIVDLNFDKLARYGMDVQDVLREMRINYDGEVITRIQYGDEEINYRLTAAAPKEKNFDFLKNLYLTNKFGKIIQLKEIAAFVPKTGLDGYKHYEGERAVSIESNITKGVIKPSEVNDLLRKKFDSMKLNDVYLLIQGEEQNQQSSTGSLLRTLLIAMLGIYLLLALQFKSMKLPLLVMIVIPFGIGGVLLVFMLHNTPLTFLGTIGIVGLTGVVVNDSLVLVDRLIQTNYAKLSLEKRIKEVAEGTGSRFRAVILTSLTTAAGVLPLAYGIGGQDFTNAPLALALGWGLIFGTAITLILVPALFLISIQIKYSLKNIFGR